MLALISSEVVVFGPRYHPNSVKSGIAEGRGLNARYHTATRSSCPK